jgi:hypothetical protein
MNPEAIQSAMPIAAFGDGTANTNVIRFVATTTDVDPLPAGWEYGGYFVRIAAEAVDVHYLFTTKSDATVVDTAAGASGAQAATLGEVVKAGTSVSRWVPAIGEHAKLYFARLGATGGSVRLTKG